MPFNKRSQNYEVALPVRGNDRGTVRCKPLPETCPDSRNVRGWDLRDRLGLGKRSGSVAAFSVRAGSTGARRGTGLIPMTLATGVSADTGAFEELVVDDFSEYAAAEPADFLGNYVPLERPSASADNGFPTADWPEVTSAPVCVIDSGTNGVYLVVNYHTTNDVQIKARAHSDIATANNRFSNIRLLCRGSDDMTDYWRVGFTLSSTTATVDFRTQTGNTLSANLASAPTFTVSGASATADDLVMRVTCTDESISLFVEWPSQAASDPKWAGHTYTLSTTTFASNKRGGFGNVVNGASGTVCTFLEAQYTRLRVESKPLVRQILGTDTESPLSGFILKTGWTSVSLTEAGVLTSAAGPADEASVQLYATIDTGNTVLNVSSAGSATTTGGGLTKILLPTAAPAVGETHAVELRWRDVSSATDDTGPVFRVSNDFLNGMKVVLPTITRSADTLAAKVVGFLTGTTVQLRFFVNGDLTGASNTNINVPLHSQTWTRWEDTGSLIRCVHNGMVVKTIAYTSDAAWAAVSASMTGTRVGAELQDTGGAFGVRIVNVGSSSSAGSGEFTSRVLVLTEGTAQHGRLDQPTSLETASGAGLFGSLPSGFAFNRKWYVVDGESQKVIDPIGNTSEEWTADVGTFPTGCRLACLYRGRAVLARQESNPAIWYMGRVFDPHDWDIGASPLATAAIAGTDPRIGQPGDAITALIPFSDDYLLFGCASSMYMLEGDPGYDGAIQTVSHKTGIVGPRAWCFDEEGNLWFLGTGGLYKMARGTHDPINVSGHRLAERLDRVNLDEVLVQLAYDAFKGCVHIFLTQLDVTEASIHVVYDVRRDSFWFDTLPRNSDPFAVCEIVGPEDEDRRIMWFGNDGYTRRWSDAATSDHDTSYVEGSGDTATEAEDPIDAFVRFAPIESQDAMLDMVLTALQFQGDSASGTTSWELLTGDSAEAVGDKTRGQGTISGTIFGNTTGFSGGHQQIIRVRTRAGVHQLVVSQNSATDTFSLERVVAMFAPVGSRR